VLAGDGRCTCGEFKNQENGGSGTLPKDKLGQSWHIVFVIRTVSAF
jgi:hypothetical protein